MSGRIGDEHAYFRAIEELFVKLRGAPLLLSPEDWHIARGWHREGVPLELIRRALEEVFARRRERGVKGKVQSLKYCAPAVESAWQEHRELTASGAPGPAPRPLDAEARLARLGDKLPGDLASTFGPRIRALTGDAEAIESALAALDRELLATAAAGLSDVRRREIERGVARRLTAFGDRLPAAERDEASARLFESELREALGLPLLSLFAPEARP